MRAALFPLLLSLMLAPLVSGCDALGIETASTLAVRKEAEARAIGSACRHAMRAIEDCYVLNPKFAKAAIYAGWREMDEYMRENKIAGVVPVVAGVPRLPAASAARPASARSDDNIITEDAPPQRVEMPTNSTH